MRIGTETYINASTGELHEMQVVEVEERDSNFLKLWVSSILLAVDSLSSKKLKVVLWLVAEAGRNRNVVMLNTREMAAAIGVSRSTLIETLRVLEQHDIIRRKTGIVFLSPEVVFKGSHNGRLEVLTRYHQMPRCEESSAAQKRTKIMQRLTMIGREMRKLERDLGELEGIEAEEGEDLALVWEAAGE